MLRKCIALVSFMVCLSIVGKIHAAEFYLSPNGNDSNIGSSTAPWKTITHAVESVSPGDTVTLKNGIYAGYVSLSVPNTTWKAENKQQAIVDGGFPPSLLNGSWNNLNNAWDSACTDKWSILLGVHANNITIDGLSIRNSCGRGIIVGDGVANATIKNNHIDWTFSAGFYVNGEASNLHVLDNDMTRISFNDIYSTSLDPDDYNVNTSLHIGGENVIMRGNLIAWGRGEIAANGARNLLFEKNIIVGNKNNMYNGWADGVIVRNNLFWSPESKNNSNTHWHKFTGNDNDWHISSRNENDDRFLMYATGLNNIAFYNNVMINNKFSFEGYHKSFASNTTQVYFGHNTLIVGPDSSFLFDASFNTKNESDPVITGIVENNIFDVSKHPTAKVQAKLSANDQLTFRNNLLPSSATNAVKGNGDVYTNNSGLTNAAYQLNFPVPAIGAANVNPQAIRNAVNLNNYYLTSSSLAINAGATSAGINSTQVPELARIQDYLLVNRLGIPDLGAFEFTGTVDTPNPEQSNEGDFNGDGVVNLQDQNLIISMYKNPYTLLDYNTVITNFRP